MARVKIDLPDKFIFTTELEIRINDINYGGHLSNDAVLSLVHESRLRFLNQYGFDELDIGGASLIMADVAIVFKSEGFYQNKIRIDVGVAEFSNFGFDIFYKLFNITTHKDLAYVKTGMVAFDYKARKVTNVPLLFKEKLQVELGGQT